MKHIIAAVILLCSSTLFAGSTTGGGGLGGAKTAEGEEVPAVEVSPDEFTRVSLDAIAGQLILVDGKEHKAGMLDFEKREIMLKNLEDQTKVVRIKEVQALKAGTK